MDTKELILFIDNWQELLYEHNVDNLKELLLALDELKAKVKRKIQEEEKYQ